MDISREQLRGWAEQKLDDLQAALGDPAELDEAKSSAQGEVRAVTELVRRFELMPEPELEQRTAAIAATLEWNFEP